MVIDTSALVAMLRDEPEAGRFVALVDQAWPRLIAAPTLVEASLVMLSRFGEAGLADLGALSAEMHLVVAPLTQEHAALAVEAFRRYGRGRHPAALNFGDCFSYALAKAEGHPLLFQGEDFPQTDVRRAC